MFAFRVGEIVEELPGLVLEIFLLLLFQLQLPHFLVRNERHVNWFFLLFLLLLLLLEVV